MKSLLELFGNRNALLAALRIECVYPLKNFLALQRCSPTFYIMSRDSRKLVLIIEKPLGNKSEYAAVQYIWDINRELIAENKQDAYAYFKHIIQEGVRTIERIAEMEVE